MKGPVKQCETRLWEIVGNWTVLYFYIKGQQITVHRSDPTSHLLCFFFLHVCKLRMPFIFLTSWILIKRRIVLHETLRWYEMEISLFINKASVEGSHSHLCILCGGFCPTTAELSSCYRGCMVCKVKNTCYLIYIEKVYWLSSRGLGRRVSWKEWLF